MTRNDRSSPNVVHARSPDPRDAIIRLYANPITLRGFLDHGMNAKLGEYCGLVHGNILEAGQDGAQEGGTDGLMGAVALFRGIKRPMIEAGLDRTIYIYVTNPLNSYAYPEVDRFRVAGPSRQPKPSDSVFVTYVEIGTRAEDMLRSWLADRASALALSGIVQDWEWVPCAHDAPNLPERHDTRYAERVW